MHQTQHSFVILQRIILKITDKFGLNNTNKERACRDANKYKVTDNIFFIRATKHLQNVNYITHFYIHATLRLKLYLYL